MLLYYFFVADSGETLIAHYIPSTLQVNTTVTAEEYLPFCSDPVVYLFDSGVCYCLDLKYSLYHDNTFFQLKIVSVHYCNLQK